MASKHVHIIVLESCEYVPLHSQRELAGMTTNLEIRENLEMGRLSLIMWWAQQLEASLKGKQEEETRSKECPLLLEAGKGRKIAYPLESQEGMQP